MDLIKQRILNRKDKIGTIELFDKNASLPFFVSKNGLAYKKIKVDYDGKFYEITLYTYTLFYVFVDESLENCVERVFRSIDILRTCPICNHLIEGKNCNSYKEGYSLISHT